MKNIILAILLFTLSAHIFSAESLTVEIREVGLSMNTNRVFVETSGIATTTTCNNKSQFSISLEETEAYLFYSVAQQSMLDGRKMKLYISETECISSSPKVEVWWSLKTKI